MNTYDAAFWSAPYHDRDRLSATIFNVRDKIEATIKKLELFSVCINKENT